MVWIMTRPFTERGLCSFDLLVFLGHCALGSYNFFYEVMDHCPTLKLPGIIVYAIGWDDKLSWSSRSDRNLDAHTTGTLFSFSSVKTNRMMFGPGVINDEKSEQDEGEK